MKRIKELFNEDPNSVNESYFEHGKFALCCGFKLFLLGLMAITHAVLPFLFVHTTSKKLDELCCSLKNRKFRE